MSAAIRSSLFILFALVCCACAETKTPTEPAASASPTPTSTTSATGRLAIVTVTLSPAGGWTYHAFNVHIEVRETRGVGIRASYWTVTAPGTSYNFPNRESGIQELFISAGGVGATDVLVVSDEGVPCSAGLTVVTSIESDDRLVEKVPNVFNCSTGYWPL